MFSFIQMDFSRIIHYFVFFVLCSYVRRTMAVEISFFFFGYSVVLGAFVITIIIQNTQRTEPLNSLQDNNNNLSTDS